MPDHRDSDPSCYLRTEPGDGADFARWYCYGCGRGGDAVDMIELVEGRSRGSAIRRAAQLAGVDHLLDGKAVPYPRSSVAPVRRASFVEHLPTPKPSPRQSVKPPPTLEPRDLASVFALNRTLAKRYRAELERKPRILEYLAGRGVTAEQIDRYSIGWAPNVWRSFAAQLDGDESPKRRELALAAGVIKARPDGETFDVWRCRVMFPITCEHEGRAVVRGFVGRKLDGDGPKYVNTRETAAYRKGSTLFGWHAARARVEETRRVVLCEGPFDVLAVDRLGVPALATVSASLSDAQAERLASLGCPVTIALDGDEAGQRGAERAAVMLRAHGVEHVDVATMPAGEDPGSMEPRELAARLGLPGQTQAVTGELRGI